VFDADPCVPTIETLGDALDGDCDGAPDTARFFFGDLGWDVALRPVALHDADNLLVFTVARTLTDGELTTQHTAVAMSFDLHQPDLDAPRRTVWQPQSPMGQSFGAVVHHHPSKVFFATAPTQPGDLVVDQLVWDDEAEVYTVTEALREPTEVRGTSGVDVAHGTEPSGNLWVGACSEFGAHFLRAVSDSGP